MAEELSLTTPKVIPEIRTESLRIGFVGLYIEGARFVVQMRGAGGQLEVITAEGAQATEIFRQLNTANLTVKSLQKRIIEWVASQRPDLAGTVTGTPD
jgi:hypothetical protein